MDMHQEREIERLKRLCSALIALNRTIARANSREEIFSEACRIATEQAGFKVAWIGRPDLETLAVNPIACAGDGHEHLDKFRVYADDRPEGRGPTGTCIREGKMCIFNDFANHPRTALCNAIATAHGIRAGAALPIFFGGELFGSLTIYASESNVFQEREIAILEEIAAAVSLALESLDREAGRKRAEEALRVANRAAEASRAQYEQVVSMISDITWRYEVDDQGRFVHCYISPVADRLLDLPVGTIGNDIDKYYSYVPAEDLPAVQEALSLGLQTLAKDMAVEYRLRKSDGTTLWVRTKGSAYLQPNGHVVAFGTTSDITDRIFAEEALRQSEHRYRRLFEVESDAVLMVDCETGRFLNVNKAGMELYGYGREEFLRLRVGDISAEPDKTYAAIADRQTTIHVRWHRKRDGTVFPVDIAGSYFDCHGRHVHVAAIRDITERRRMDEAIRQSEEKYRGLIELCPDAILVADLTGKATFVSKETWKLLDAPDEYELIGRNTFKYVIEADRPRLAANLAELLRVGRRGHTEYTVLRPNGTTVPVELSSALIRDAQGQPAACMAMIRDISERKRAEEALTASEARYRSLFHGSPIAMREEDYSEVRRYLDGLRSGGVADYRDYFERHPEAVRQCAAMVKILDVNQACLNLCGATTRQELLAGLPQIFVDETYNRFCEVLLAMVEGRTVLDTEAPIRTLQGEMKQVLLRWATAPGNEQSYARVYVSQTDITDRKRAEEALSRNEAMLSCILNSPLPLSIFWKDRDCVYLGCNETLPRARAVVPKTCWEHPILRFRGRAKTPKRIGPTIRK